MRRKKLIAPVLITCWLILTFLGYLVACFLLPIPLFMKIVAGVILLALVGVSIWVMVERVQEIETTDDLPGKKIEAIGLVKGSTIQSKNIGRDISQSFKTIVGGELKSYTQMMDEARALATKRMVQEAEQLGADAIVCMRYSSASVMSGAAEVMAYGTAVKIIG